MRAAGVFAAGVVAATVLGLIAIESWLHLVEHTAYTKAAR